MAGKGSGKRVAKAKSKGGKGNRQKYDKKKTVKQIKTKSKTRNRFVDKKPQWTAIDKATAPANSSVYSNRGIHETEQESASDLTE
jgi:hypothetical protein